MITPTSDLKTKTLLGKKADYFRPIWEVKIKELARVANSLATI